MPLILPCDDTAAIGLGEFVEYLHDAKIDTADLASMAEAAPMLRRLANDRRFLVDIVAAEMKNYRRMQEGNSYGAQVFLLDTGPRRPGQNFFMRACFWPSGDDQIMKVTGEQTFTYFQPHDHNFNFLTVGYLGPGYWSNYFEYDYDRVAGCLGEKVDLRFIEKARLSEGKVMLYRANVDVHDQLPADAFSVSLNVMESTGRVERLDQYGFDLATSTINLVANRIGAEALFDVLAYHGDPADHALLAHIGLTHVSDRVRFCAWQSMSRAAATPGAAIEVLARIPATSPSRVLAWARARAADLEALPA